MWNNNNNDNNNNNTVIKQMEDDSSSCWDYNYIDFGSLLNDVASSDFNWVDQWFSSSHTLYLITCIYVNLIVCICVFF